MKKAGVVLIIVCSLLSFMYASGTRAGSNILAPSTNLKVEYGDGGGGTTTKNASEFGINDQSSTVLEINGLVETSVDLSGLSGLSFSEGIYKSVIPGNDYVLRFSYLNRGNNDEVVSFSSTVTDIDWAGSGEVTKDILEDATHTFIVTLNAGVNQVENLEKATINVMTQLVDPDNVVSYNAFAAAVSDMLNGGYGGIDDIAHEYGFQIEGYNLMFNNRGTAVQAPPSYPNTSTDVVPGAKIRYSIVFKNNTKAIAKDVILRDVIPNNCHLYYTETPTVEGAVSSAWEGALDNNADSSTPEAVKFKVTVPAEGTVTASYSVTID